MITQDIINTEFDLAKRIYVYYLDSMNNCLYTGSNKYVKWYKDLCILYFLTEALNSVRIVDSTMYIGNDEIDADNFHNITKNIREFINYDVRELVYAELDADRKIKDYSSPLIPPTIVSYQSFNQDWLSVLITIDVDDKTEVTVPFDIDNVTTASISVTVNDNDPIPVTSALEEGVHFVNSTMYWHTYYNLKAGDVVRIQYLLNN